MPAKRNRLRQLAFLGSFAGTALLVVTAVATIQMEARRRQNDWLTRHRHLLEKKAELSGMLQELAEARQQDLAAVASSPLERQDLEEHLSRISADATALAGEATDQELSSTLNMLERAVRRYADSVKDAIALINDRQQAKVTQQQLNDLENAILIALSGQRDTYLYQQFMQVVILERTYHQDLGMGLAGELEQRLEAYLGLLVARRADRLAGLVEQWRKALGERVESNTATDLQLAQNHLQYERIGPIAAKLQTLFDGQILAVSAGLEQVHRRAQIRMVWCFVLALLLFGLLGIEAYRRRRKLLRNLGQLTDAVDELAQGKFALDGAISRIAGPTGELASRFLTMARQIENQIHTIEWERQQAEQANLTKDRFLANMSHEIRTPMNGVLGLLELLDGTRLDDTQQEYVTLLRSSTHSLLTILNDILDFSKIEAGMLELDLRPFDPRNLIKDCVCLFSPTAQEKGLALNFQIAAKTPTRIIGDVHRLRQVLTNLIGNALKFTERGKVRVEIAQARQTALHVELEFRVSDTGIGIPKPIQDKVFQPFVQASAGLNRKYGGTGLGLSVCRMLVERMGGSLYMTSEEGLGTTLSFTLPFEQVRYEEAVTDKPATQRQGGETLIPGLKILVAEDNPVNQKVILRMLQQLGYEADLACDGDEAVHLVDKQIYDFIFMDVQMPRVDGLEATERILAMRRNDPPVIVALTANVFERDRESCLRAGMHDFVPKPVTQAKLREVLLRWTTSNKAPG